MVVWQWSTRTLGGGDRRCLLPMQIWTESPNATYRIIKYGQQHRHFHARARWTFNQRSKQVEPCDVSIERNERKNRTRQTPPSPTAQSRAEYQYILATTPCIMSDVSRCPTYTILFFFLQEKKGTTLLHASRHSSRLDCGRVLLQHYYCTSHCVQTYRPL